MKQQTDNPLDENGYPIYGTFSPKKQTAVEWLLYQIENKNGKEFSSYYIEFIEQAKEMEERQSQLYAAFCLKCVREGEKLLQFKDFVKL